MEHITNKQTNKPEMQKYLSQLFWYIIINIYCWTPFLNISYGRYTIQKQNL